MYMARRALDNLIGITNGDLQPTLINWYQIRMGHELSSRKALEAIQKVTSTIAGIHY